MYQEIDNMIYSSWDIECDRLKSVIMGHFLPLVPPPPLKIKKKKNQNFESMKKIAGDILIIHMCTKNQNHMRYGSWDAAWDRRISWHFGPFFAILPPNNLENKNFEKLKRASRDVIILQMCTKNHDHMMYTSRDMEYHRHFGQKLQILSFYHKWWYMMYGTKARRIESFWTIFCLLTLTLPIIRKIDI